MASAFTLISTATVGSGGATSMSFSSIPGTYTDLLLKISALNTTGLSNNGVTFNGTSSGYKLRALRGTGSALGTFTESTWGGGAYFPAGYNPNGSIPSSGDLYIFNYTSSNYKVMNLDFAHENNGNPGYSFLSTGYWENTSAITSITVSTDTWSFSQYTTASLYGIKKS